MNDERVVVRRICALLNLTEKTVLSKSRLEQLVDARSIISQVLHTYYGLTDTEVGPLIGRDRSSVVNIRKRHRYSIDAQDYKSRQYTQKWKQVLTQESQYLKPKQVEVGLVLTEMDLAARVKQYAKDQSVTAEEAMVYLVLRGFAAVEKT